MKKILVIVILIILVGLGIGVYLVIGQSSSKPPLPIITVGSKKVAVIQGSYCWKGFFSAKCVDMAAPPEINKIANLKPLVVTPESQLKIEFKNKPYKNTMEANKWMTNEDAEAVKINNNSLSAPKEKGVYVYDISARWKQGSASYVFVIKVQSNTEHLSKNKNADIKDVLDTERFVQMLKNKGYEVIKPVKDNKPAMDSLLNVYPTFYKVNRKVIGIYEYKDEESALKDSKRITKDGNIIGHGILEWVDKPNFYHRGKIIVSYIGSEFKFQNNLEAILGESITQ